MTIEFLQTLSNIAFIAALLFFILSVALFFLFDIPKIFGEITGSTARKAIEDIRRQNEKTGNKAYMPSPVNAERGRLTDKISPSGQVINNEKKSGISVGTERLNTSELVEEQQETTMLVEETASDNNTDNNYNETMVLTTDTYNADVTVEKAGSDFSDFSVDFDISFMGSNEIIE